MPKSKAKRSVASERSISVAPWAKQISAAWNRTVKGIFEVGRLLLKAERALRNDFSELIGRPGEPGGLPFGYETARRLIAIAEDKRLARILTHGPKMRPPVMLPPHWRTLHELTQLSTEQLDCAVKEGQITAEMHRSDVVYIRDYCDNATASPESEPSRPTSTLIPVTVRDATIRYLVPVGVPAPVSRASNLRLLRPTQQGQNLSRRPRLTKSSVAWLTWGCGCARLLIRSLKVSGVSYSPSCIRRSEC